MEVKRQQKKRGDVFVEVKRQQKKKEMKPVFPGHNSMEKRRVTFKRDNGLPLAQKKDLDILSEVNRGLFEMKVRHCIRIQGVTKNTQGCLSTITTPGATAEMLIQYREIVIKAARKVDAGIVDIKMNELWERVKMHGVNFDRYLGKKTGGGLEKLSQELQAENEGVVLPLAITSAKNISVRAEWLRQSGRTPSEPSETPWWRITPHTASRPRIPWHFALQMPFRRFFSLCRSPILNKHSGVVANYMSEWVHWVHPCIGIAMQWVTLRKSLLVFLLH